MGWKRIRDHYRIGHIVQIVDGSVHIGSAYISDIIIITANGKITKRYDRQSGDLARYQQEIEADARTFARLLALQDELDNLQIVYTWEGGHVIQKLCETPGWPNVTIGGEIMHDNRFSTDRAEVVRWARQSNAARIEGMRETITGMEAVLEQSRALLRDMIADKTLLDAERPTPEEEAAAAEAEAEASIRA